MTEAYGPLDCEWCGAQFADGYSGPHACRQIDLMSRIEHLEGMNTKLRDDLYSAYVRSCKRAASEPNDRAQWDKDLDVFYEQPARSRVRSGWAQEWLERERGWGERPDGFSLHESEDAVKQFIADYWKSMPGSGPQDAPDEYSAPSGNPFPVEIQDGQIEFDTGGRRMFRQHLPDGVTRIS